MGMWSEADGDRSVDSLTVLAVSDCQYVLLTVPPAADQPDLPLNQVISQRLLIAVSSPLFSYQVTRRWSPQVAVVSSRKQPLPGGIMSSKLVEQQRRKNIC